MSVKAITWVWESSRASGIDRLVLVAIADCANDRGEQAYPSTASLAAKTGLSVRTVQRSVQVLVALGELTCEPNAGRRGTNLYGLPMRPPSESHPRQRVTPVRESGIPVTQSLNPRQADTRTVIEPSKDQNLQTPLVSAALAAEPSEVKRAQIVTRTYTDRQPLSNFAAILAMVRKAFRAGHDPLSVAAALERLCDDGREPTVASLRYELEGKPPSRRDDKHAPVRRGLELVQRQRKGLTT